MTESVSKMGDEDSAGQVKSKSMQCYHNLRLRYRGNNPIA